MLTFEVIEVIPAQWSWRAVDHNGNEVAVKPGKPLARPGRARQALTKFLDGMEAGCEVADDAVRLPVVDNAPKAHIKTTHRRG